MSVRVRGRGKAGLAKVAESLRRLANGSAAPLAAADGARYINAEIRPVLAKHVKTGHARDVTRADAAGDSIVVQYPVYLIYHPEWWFFGRGVPRYLLKRIATRYRAHSNAIMRGKAAA